MLKSIAAGAAAHCGRTEEAIANITGLVPWLEHAPAWTVNFNLTVGNAVDVLWVSERLDHVEVIEQALREKVIVPDFRSPMVDGRLALARLCALTGRHDEAVSWFAAAREALAEQGARPLLAICDYDEALMYARRGDPGDAALARPLLDAARRQFEAIGMTGWIPRAERLSERLG